MMQTVLDLLNLICKIAFTTYAWVTMIRINYYIKEMEDMREK